MLIVYVGAVAVLFLFVVMMLNVANQKNEWFGSAINSSHIPMGLLVSVVICMELLVVLGGWKFKPNVISSSSVIVNQNRHQRSTGDAVRFYQVKNPVGGVAISTFELSTTLATTITATDTSIVLTDGSEFPTSGYIVIGALNGSLVIINS